MFNSVSFNVVLGLTLVYLLYSLLGTILSEFVATLLKLRPKMLRMSLYRMLTDGNVVAKRNIPVKQPKDRHSVKGQKALKVLQAKIEAAPQQPGTSKGKFAGLTMPIRFLSRRAGHQLQVWRHEDRYSLTGRFYEYPSIKYLSKQNAAKGWRPLRSTLPSYISKSLFASTMINMMQDKGDGPGVFERVQYCLRYNTLHMEYNTRAQFQSLLGASHGDIKLFDTKLQDWYAETMHRANGWYKRRIKLILFLLGLFIACIFNIDTIEIATTLSKDQQTAAQLAMLSAHIAHDSAIQKLSTEPSRDSTRMDTRFDSNYSRLAQDITAANHILGLGWDADQHTYHYQDTFNLSKDIRPSSREVLSRSLRNYDKMQQRLQARANDLVDDRSRVTQNRQDYRDALRSGALEQARKNLIPKAIVVDTTLVAGVPYRANNMLYLTVLALDSVNYLKTRDSLFQLSAFVDSILGIHRVYITAVIESHGTLQISGDRYLGFWGRLIYVLFTHPWSLRKVIGLLITAIAVSLGSPFWFNLLVKLASLRNTGDKPEDSKLGFSDPAALPGQLKDNVLTDRSVTNTTPVQAIDPMDNTIGLIATALAEVEGFIRVNRGWECTPVASKKAPEKTPAIEVQVTSSAAENAARAILARRAIAYPVVYTLNSTAVAHVGTAKCGSAVYNANDTKEIGTVGCFAAKQGDDGIYLLSCWHVLKGDHDYTSKTIAWKQVQITHCTSALLTDGCLTDKFDVGFARLTDSTGIVNNFGQDFRTVTPADAKNSTPVTFSGASTINGAGFIDHHSTSVSLGYPGGKTYLLNDIIRICTYNAAGKPMTSSTGGDSGAVVIDNTDSPIGLIIGGDSKYTYVAKFSNFLDPDNGMYKEYSLSI